MCGCVFEFGVGLLGDADVGVAEHLGDVFERDAAVDQVGGVGAAEGVRGDGGGERPGAADAESGAVGDAFDEPPGVLLFPGCAAAGGKQGQVGAPVLSRAQAFAPGEEDDAEFVDDRHGAQAGVGLGGADADDAPFEVDVLDAERERLADPEAGPAEEPDQDLLLFGQAGAQERFGFVAAQAVVGAAADAQGFDPFDRVSAGEQAAVVEVAVEGLERREVEADAVGGGLFGGVPAVEVVVDLLAADAGRVGVGATACTGPTATA